MRVLPRSGFRIVQNIADLLGFCTMVGCMAAVAAGVALVTSRAQAEATPPLDLEIVPVGLQPAVAEALTDSALQRPEIQSRLRGSRYRVLRAEFNDATQPDSAEGKERVPALRLEVYDYSHDRLLEISGDPNGLEPMQVVRSDDLLPPSEEELDEAISILRNSPDFAQTRIGRWKPYPAMPGVLDLRTDPSQRLERIVTIGILPTETRNHRDFPRHEIVGVNLSRLSGERILRFPDKAPPGAIARPQVCAVPSADQYTTRRGTQGQAAVTVRKEGQEVWNFRVVRPSASSGSRGSGVELRDVTYRGKKVLRRAHVPILNVQYRGDVCGPYRDWQYQEGMFAAEGTLLAPGILQASAPARTIFESNDDRGNFRGVAIYTEGNETVLVSELEAGWYRYKSEFRLAEDGTIRPRWGFAGVQSSCTCNAHMHHAYFRLDFDIGDWAHNQIQVLNQGTWVPVERETKFLRNTPDIQWRVMDPASGQGYLITPGPDDGKADAYARGDAWALKYAKNELDDASVYTGTATNLDAFVTGQDISQDDVVFWYGAHFLHVSDDFDANSNHIVGPTLHPIGF